MDAAPRRVGRVTVAVGLVAAGSALLIDNLAGKGPRFTDLLLRLWPAFLIGFGLEFLVTEALNRRGEPRPVRFEAGGALVLAGVLALASLVRAFAGFGWSGAEIDMHMHTHTVTRSVPAAGARTLVVEIDAGRVILQPHSADEVRVEVEYGFLGIVPPDGTAAAGMVDVAVEGETIRVTGRDPGRDPGIGLGLGRFTASYRIYAPHGLDVRVQSGVGSILAQGYEGNLDLRTGAGGVAVEGGAGALRAETTSGSVHVAHFAGPVTAATSAGPVTAREVAGELTIRTGTGVITVEEHSGPGLTAEARTGAISARFAEPPAGPVTLRTGAGNVSLIVPEASDVTVTATTRSGSIAGLGDAGGTGPARTATRTLGAGTHPVRLEANTGSILFGTY